MVAPHPAENMEVKDSSIGVLSSLSNMHGFDG